MFKELAEDFLKIQIRSNIEHTGMADSVMPNTISFLANAKFADEINRNQNVIAVFVKEEDANTLCNRIETIIVNDPKAMLYTLHNEFCKQYVRYAPNMISANAKIHPTAHVAEVGVVLGNNVIIGPNATILSGVDIGDNSIIGANCVIGAEGFQIFIDVDGVQRQVFHDGKAIIGKNVDILPSVVVSKGLMGRDTVIEDEVKLDSMVYVSHRVHIGRKTQAAGGANFGGSSNVGENVWIGPYARLANRVRIDNGACVRIGSVVINNVKAGEAVSGNFAIPHEKHLVANAKDKLVKVK